MIGSHGIERLHTSEVAHQAVSLSRFLQHEATPECFYSPCIRKGSPSQGYPSISSLVPIYTPGERYCESKVSFPRTQRNAGSNADHSSSYSYAVNLDSNIEIVLVYLPLQVTRKYEAKDRKIK